MLQSGDIISGMYQVIREIGTGGMGVIYIGYHLHLQKQIVIKKIKETCVDRVNVRGEADILKQLRHTYLPQVYDFLEVGNDVYTVMDYIPGENLQYYIDHNYTFPEETILLWMRELCEVLDYLHTRKPRILHSDIKPANIMVTPEGDICLIDFNISLDGSVTQIILITSASGGVGKTSVAFGLCRCLERNYKKTLYVNADRLQSFQWMLENGEPIRDASVYAGLSGNLGNVYRIVRHVIRKEGFSYLPPFKAALMSLGIPYRVFALLAEAARKEQEYDYIVIDADSVFDEEKAALMQLADKILIVTKQTEYAVKATNELIQNVNRNNSDKYIFLCNDFKKEEENALLLPTAAHRFTVSEYIEHLPAYEMKGSGLPVQTPGLQKAAFLIM